ncbi:MAG: dephospho-CoA kinase [Candidatus Marinimicrobia bacterium]|nr:dephospho-CoA kinase [Candidatus Neomarinimicrobiota bacterium]
MVTLGITGGLGSGKSFACQRLKEKGAVIFDADNIAKDILQTVPEVQEKIAEVFGDTVIKNGVVDNQKLADIAFSNEENQAALNNIVHPFVIEEFEKKREAMQNREGLLVIDAPLIFESGLDNHLDYTVLIYTTYKLRIARAIRRGKLSRDQILRRMDLQMPEEEKREMASFVIENNGSVEHLYEEIDKLYNELVGE